jgi:hypothetical protein
VDVPLYIVVGRSQDCDVILRDPSVSGRHARLSWRGDKILLEDLGSANGTWLDGNRIRQTELKVGAEVTLGNAPLEWSEPALKPFLRRGARGDTLVGMRIPGRRFICGSCGARGVMPPGFKTGQLRCGSCGVSLAVGGRRASGWLTGAAALLVLAGAVASGVWMWREGASADTLRRAVERFGLAQDEAGAGAASPQERSIRRRIAGNVRDAIDPTHPDTRNAAVRVAAEEEGPFRIEQVARIWSHVRGRWAYANDPRGEEFFSRASATLTNLTEHGKYGGDCDDFAIVLAAMTESIGGRARIVMLDGEQGGHAYAEVCIQAEPEQVAQRMAAHYRTHRDEYLGSQRLSNIHFRSSSDCPVWLNLDWNARVPGGPYGREYWAVAIYPDGTTETLAPSGGAAPEAGANPQVGASAPP